MRAIMLRVSKSIPHKVKRGTREGGEGEAAPHVSATPGTISRNWPRINLPFSVSILLSTHSGSAGR